MLPRPPGDSWEPLGLTLGKLVAGGNAHASHPRYPWSAPQVGLQKS